MPPTNELVVIVYFVVAALYMLASIVYLCISMKRDRRIGKTQQKITSSYDELRDSLDTLAKARRIGARILNQADMKNQWEHVQERVAAWLAGDAEAKARAPDYPLFIKTFLVFFHEPQDAAIEQLFSGLLHLLRNGFHVIWVYSRSDAPAFPTDIKEKIKSTERDADKLVQRCRFISMTEEDKRIPLNFAVLAPFLPKTITYVFFPGDGTREFGIRVEQASVFANKIDELARRCLTRLSDLDVQDSVDWQKIRKRARAFVPTI